MSRSRNFSCFIFWLKDFSIDLFLSSFGENQHGKSNHLIVNPSEVVLDIKQPRKLLSKLNSLWTEWSQVVKCIIIYCSWRLFDNQILLLFTRSSHKICSAFKEAVNCTLPFMSICGIIRASMFSFWIPFGVWYQAVTKRKWWKSVKAVK